MIKKFCAIFLLISSALLITIFAAEVIKDKSKQVNIISKFNITLSETLPEGYYKVDGRINTKSVSIEDHKLSYSKKINCCLERYSIHCPEEYDLDLIDGDVIDKGSIIASNGDDIIVAPCKSRFLKYEDNEVYLEKIDYIELVFDIQLDEKMSPGEYEFQLIYYQKYNLLVKEYFFDEATQIYTFKLLWKLPPDYLLYGDEVEVIMNMENENVFLISDSYVFYDEDGAYVKKYMNTALFGAIYTKKRVTVINTVYCYCLVEGDILNDTIFFNL